ncbi:MAG: hypothetical protein AAFX94_06945, partial [Myxococcota bacterium]
MPGMPTLILVSALAQPAGDLVDQHARETPRTLTPVQENPILDTQLSDTSIGVVSTTRAGAMLPLLGDAGRSSWLGLGVAYGFERIELDRALAGASRLNLQSLRVGPEGKIQLGRDLAFAFAAQAVYAGDLDAPGSDAWLPFGRGSLSYALSGNTTVHLGAVLVRLANGLRPLPSAGLTYRSDSKRFRFDLGAPETQLSYRFSTGTTVFVRAGLDASSFAFEDEQGDAALLHRFQINSTAGVRQAIWGPLAVHLSGGTAAYQSI